jgi:hypothetical protein
MTLVIHCPDQRKLLAAAFVDRLDKRGAAGTDPHSLEVRDDEASNCAAQPMLRQWAAGFIRFLEWPVVPAVALVLDSQFRQVDQTKGKMSSPPARE